MKSLYGKLFFGFLFSIIISFTIAGYFGVQKQEESIQNMVVEEFEHLRNVIQKEIIAENFSEIAHACYSSNVELLVVEDQNFYLYGNDYQNPEINTNGANAFYSLVYDGTSLKPIPTHIGVYKYGREYFVFDEMNGSQAFYRFNMASEYSLFENALMFALIGIFVIGSFVFLIIADIIVKPIKRLTKATNDVTHGNYDVQVNYYGKDELATLSDSFNLMAKRLVKSEENRQKFISDVSHEFQTPLTSIQGFAKILTAEQLNDDQRRRYGGIILEQAIRLSTLSKNMMQLTLLEGDDLVLDKKKYSLINQIQRIVDMQQGFASEKQVDIVSNFPKGDVMIVADEDRMEQVFINLINNAVKYTLEEGVVTVNVKKNLMDVEISIEDTGIGMNKDALQRIFDRFYRADKSRSIRGNGLGLSIVKRILDLHNYKISVESQVDVGSVFKINIPLEMGLRIPKKNNE